MGEADRAAESGGDGVSLEDALICLVLLVKGLMRVHPDGESWALGEMLTGAYLEGRYRFSKARFGHLLRRSLEHAENVRTSLEAEGRGASFADDPESMVAVLSADLSIVEFAPHVRDAAVCLVCYVEILAQRVILSEETWALARLNAAKMAPRYGLPPARFRFLLDGAMRTIGRLLDANPFSAVCS